MEPLKTSESKIAETSTTKTEKEVEQYKFAIARLMNTRSPMAIGNDRKEHAAALYELFFNTAVKTIWIFCKDLNAAVFGNVDVIAAYEKAKGKKIDIKILIQSDMPDAAFFRDPEIIKSIRKAEELDKTAEFNFSVRDKESFRFEEDNTSVKAFAVMYDPIHAEKLTDVFLTMWERSTPIVAPA